VVAAKHYLQIIDEHLAREAQPVEAVQNPVQRLGPRTRRRSALVQKT
jgi:hypothetical protein